MGEFFRNKIARRAALIAWLILTLFLLFAQIPSAVSYVRAEEIEPTENAEQSRKIDVAEISERAKYDSRDYGFVTPVRDQGDSNLCWAYASVSVSEVSILRSGIDPSVTKDNLSLSPEALGYSRWYRPIDPLGNTQAVYSQEGSNWYHASGDASYCATLMSQWCGPIDKAGPSNANPFENALYRLDNAVHINSTQVSEIKRAIATYGAVTFSYNNVREVEYYNPARESGTASYPHACTLIGWDDTIPAENFLPNGASKNGGWLVKNSYASLPYFYLSYDAKTDSVFAFDFTAKETYDYNYFYDYDLTDHLNFTLKVKKACEIYEAKQSTAERTEYLKAVNVGFIGKNVTAKVDIYVDPTNESDPESGKRAGGGTATFDYGGFRTVRLDTPVALEKGRKFACVVGVSNPDDSVVLRNMLGKTGNHSFVCKDIWQSTNNYTPRIKAFTSLGQNTEPAPHVHSLVSYREKSATCTADGIRAHDRCSTCGKTFVNGEEKSADELKIAATGHRYGEWIAEVPATASATGTKGHKDCTVCGKHFGADNREIADLVLPKTDEGSKIVITVENGSIAGGNGHSVAVDRNGTVTVIAAEIEGKIFKGWSADGGKTIVSVSPTYTFTATKNSTLAAVYDDTAGNSDAPSESGLGAGAIAGITVGSVCFALILVYVFCYFALYRKGGGANSKAIGILYAPLNAIFKKKK